MREIKFRGKSIFHRGWCFGDLIQYKSGELAILDFFSKYGYEATEIINRTLIDSKTLGQFTGLKDKNGKEIYEGDILRLWRSEGILGELRGEYYKPLVVEYSDLWCQFTVEDKQNKNAYGIWQQFAKFEVIGNIYENPELLESEVM